MRTFIEFLKITILGGLFVLLPVLLFYLLLTEALQAIVGMATPIADLFPKGTFDEAKAQVLIDQFIKTSDYEFECSKIVGRKFDDVGDHANYLHDGGCSEIIETLAIA